MYRVAVVPFDKNLNYRCGYRTSLKAKCYWHTGCTLTKSKLPNAMIKYLNNRECPHCGSIVRIMLLKFNPKISTINGICRRCDYSIKWQIIEGNISLARNLSLRTNISPAAAKQAVNKLEVLR